MKYLIVFVAVMLVAKAIDEQFLQQTRARLRALMEECVASEHAKMSDLDMILNLQIPDTHEGRCLLFCAHKKLNMQNEDGSINEKGALETFEAVKDVDVDFHDKLVKTFHHCSSTPFDSDPCMYSAALSVCFLNKAKEEGIHELLIE